MMLDPWSMGLTLCAVLVFFLLLRVAIPAIILLIRGEEEDSAFQLTLEKKEMLASAVLWLVWLYVLGSPFLLTVAAFDLGRQIPGAMCPIGTFNANIFGFPLLLVRLWGVFFVLVWLVLYALDIRTATMPFRKSRRYVIVFLFSWMLVDTLLQTVFFASINPVTLTSCCAVVFDPTGSFLENPVGILARHPTKAVFIIVAVGYISIGAWAVKYVHPTCRLGYGLLSPLFFFFCLAAVISCISPYIYALPHHHCPFCIMTGKERWVGIPLVMSLYIGSVSGWFAGIWELASRFLPLTVLPEKIRSKSGPFFVTAVIGNSVFITGSLMVMAAYEMFGEFI